MKLSIIIPVLNSADTLDRQLAALSRQEWTGDWEVIVADNGSSDGTQAVAQSWRGRLPGLRVLDASARRGAGYARNHGATHAHGEALVFVDADDEVTAGWLAAMHAALERHEFVANRLLPHPDSDPVLVGTRRCPQQDGLQSYSDPSFLPHAGACGLGIRKAVHDAVGGFDESFLRLQDTDYCWRVQLSGVPLYYVPDAVVYMRFRGTPRAAYRQARDWGEYNVRLYKKYRPLGMPRRSLKRGLRSWLRLARRLPQDWALGRRHRWLWDLNWSLGRLRGAVKYRTLAF